MQHTKLLKDLMRHVAEVKIREPALQANQFVKVQFLSFLVGPVYKVDVFAMEECAFVGLHDRITSRLKLVDYGNRFDHVIDAHMA